MQFIVPISQPGGKVMGINKLLSYFPDEINYYIEPFLGSGAVGMRLLYDKKIKKHAVFSDINTDLINFWVDLKLSKQNLLDFYNQYLNLSLEQSKLIFKDIPKNGKYSWQYLFQNRLAFSSRENDSFSEKRFNLNYHKNCLKRVELSNQLLNSIPTLISNNDYKTSIYYYDRPDALFYLDPPYFEVSKNIYKHSNIDYQELFSVLKSIKGKFILSLNDHQYIKDLFKEFNIYTWEKHYHMRQKNKAKNKAKELIITNFKVGNNNA